MEGGYKDLKVYQLAYKLAMEIFEISKIFPKEEIYSLTDQIRRSSRSVSGNISEAFRKRRYPKSFIAKLSDSEGRVLPDCFLMPPGTTALDFAFKLHTDFGKYFIRAIDVKKKMPIGKDHVLKPSDVVEIVSGK